VRVTQELSLGRREERCTQVSGLITTTFTVRPIPEISGYRTDTFGDHVTRASTGFKSISSGIREDQGSFGSRTAISTGPMFEFPGRRKLTSPRDSAYQGSVEVEFGAGLGPDIAQQSLVPQKCPSNNARSPKFFVSAAIPNEGPEFALPADMRFRIS
jgi:hypothetical protein